MRRHTIIAASILLTTAVVVHTGCSTAFVGMGNRWTFEEGDFHVAVGRESLRIRSTEGRVY